MEATYWDQRMKQQWAKCGARNTRHFHLSFQKRRTKNTISHLQKDDHTWISDQGEIARELVHHFHTLFKEPPNPVPSQFSIHGNAAENLDNDELCRIPTIEEIWHVVVQMGSFTPPGPDGYSPVFCKRCWDIICNDVYRSIKNIFQYDVLPDLLNHINITLIPKIKNPASASDYRPIYLCNVLYKMVTKILLNMIKSYLENFIYGLKVLLFRGDKFWIISS